MELKDFTEKNKKQIKQGLSTAELSDKEAAACSCTTKNGLNAFLSLSEGSATTKTVDVQLSNT